MKKTAFPLAVAASEILNSAVGNLEGEQVGKLEELVINIDSGRISYGVLSLEDFLGRNEKLFSIPWHALTMDTENKRLILNVDKEKLKNAPGFDKEHWPDFVDQDWGLSIHQYYGFRPHWEE